jgi:V/A-type H+-transporting ATPase subunit A
MSENTPQGTVVGVNGNMVSVAFETSVIQNEVAYVLAGEDRLKSEVIRVRGREADLQVFESTEGIRIGDKVDFSGELLSVELGPGLLKQVYDGLQNPLPELAEKAGLFLKRGLYVYPLDRAAKWAWTPKAAVGDTVRSGDCVGSVPEGIFEHRIMVPFAWPGEWKLTWIATPANLPSPTPWPGPPTAGKSGKSPWSRPGP